MLRFALLSLLLAGACTKRSEKYCEMNPQDLENCPDGGPDGGSDPDSTGSGCTDDTACAAPTGVCDLTASQCVQCTTENATACTGTTPVCADQACTACTKHADCTSNVCLDDGSCAEATSVAYVREGGSDQNDCSIDARCATVTKALAANKSIVKIDGAVVEATQILLADRAVALVGEVTPQASITRTTGGPLVRIDGTSTVAIRGLQLIGASNVNTGLGLLVDASFDGTLVVDRVKLYDNVAGGISLNGSGRFTITNSIIAYNGTAQGSTKSVVGGVAITNDSMGSRFEFNTIVGNKSSNNVNVPGIECNAPNVAANGNLIYDNYRPEGTGIVADGPSQRAGGCQFGASLATFGAAGDPKFVRPADEPVDFHLTAASPATVIDVVTGCTGIDMDGQRRPIGGACDLGADEAR